MKFKKHVLSTFILLVLLLSITAISAADLNDTDNTAVDSKNESFTYFQTEIDTHDSTFDLDRNYKFDNQSDLMYLNGVKVARDNFTINGNNHVIDCNSQARALTITGKNVEINNLIIKNGFFNYGSAINSKSKLTLNNVTFINCSCNRSTNFGAVYVFQGNLIADNCKFIDNVGGGGASITSYYSTVKITNSTFKSSSDKIVKGQIYLQMTNATIEDCDFLNTTSKYAAAIFANENVNLNISNSRFKNLHANKTAGAIAAKQILTLNISDCEFDNDTSENNGGAIFVDAKGSKNKDNHMNTTIASTTFNNCYSGFGGAILQLGGNLIISASNLTKNKAEYEGGALYTSFASAQIYESLFKSNSVEDDISYGGAAYFDMGSIRISDSRFEKNLGHDVSTLYGYESNITLINNYFNNPSNVTSIYTAYKDIIARGNNFTTDTSSTNNTGNNNYNFENTANPFIILNNTLSFDELPEKFDLRDYGWVSLVKNQGFMGSCWAFGCMAALESALMRYANVTYSLSVNNAQNSMLKYSKYGSMACIEGGQPENGMQYLINWLGIFPDVYDGYDELGKISSLYVTPEDIHIQNAVIIPKRKNVDDNDLIKEALMEYGAVAVSHNANFNESAYYNPVTHALYYTGKGSSTHAVAVVGWDDNYSADNFNPQNRPEGDGAWIVKNSWGSNWGDGGYFYVSYYDKSFADDKSVAFIINNDSYSRIYQRDLGGEIDFHESGKYYYNEFTADADELIAAVGTLFDKEDVNYTFEIAVNGIVVYEQEGVSSFGGYETIKLDKYVQIKKGDTFRVIFKNRVPILDFIRINLEPNKSKVSVDGKTWTDLYDEDEVAILKAYTIADVNITDNLVKYCGDDTAFTAHVGAGERVIFEFEGEFYNVTADENGTCKLPIDKYDGKYNITTTYNNISIVNYIIITSTIISFDVERGYNSNYNYKAQVLSPTGTPLNNTKVAVSINGKFSNYTTDSSGFITIKFTKLVKDQIIIVTNPSNADNKQTKISVKSRFAGASNVVMYYFDGSKFKARIVGDDGKYVGKGQTVTVKLNKKTYKAKTSTNGYITLKIPKTVKPGTYKIKATYNGQTITKTVKVKQNLKTSKYSVKKSAKKLIVKATLKNGKTAVKGKKITLKLNGKKFTAKTNKYGIVKFTIKKNVIKKLKAGKKYTMKVNYLKNTIKTTLKVKR